MNAELNYPDIRDAVSKLCATFPNEYWRDLDSRHEYPTEFVSAFPMQVICPLQHFARLSTNCLCAWRFGCRGRVKSGHYYE